MLINFRLLSVTLNLEVGMQVLRMTHRLIIVTTCGKYLQNPLIYEKVMDWTQNIPFNRLCKSLTSTCDIDLWGRDTCVTHGISSYHCDLLCQVFSKSFDLWRSYGRDTKYTISQTLLTFDLWPLSVTLILEVGVQVLSFHIVLLLCIFMPSYFKIPKKL
jgi:hypothetical protein